jgi:UDP-N-acetylmuramate: L-alanyl-gamma-D-glutamyl-meso-diaminopimelate ligase
MTKPNQPLFTRYPTPSNVKKIHLIGIAGAGMGAFACMLQDAGFEVRGSDQNVYPPMSDTLKAKNIPYHEGWQASNLDWQPDWVIVGNVCRRDHIEVLTTSTP